MKVFVLASLFIAQSVSASSYVIKYGHWQADETSKHTPVRTFKMLKVQFTAKFHYLKPTRM